MHPDFTTYLWRPSAQPKFRIFQRLDLLWYVKRHQESFARIFRAIPTLYTTESFDAKWVVPKILRCPIEFWTVFLDIQNMDQKVTSPRYLPIAPPFFRVIVLKKYLCMSLDTPECVWRVFRTFAQLFCTWGSKNWGFLKYFGWKTDLFWNPNFFSNFWKKRNRKYGDGPYDTDTFANRLKMRAIASWVRVECRRKKVHWKIRNIDRDFQNFPGSAGNGHN